MPNQLLLRRPGPEPKSPAENVKSLIVKRRKFLIVAAAFCLLGGTLLVRSQAATNSIQIEAESGQMSGNYGDGPTAGASGSKSVNFGKTPAGGGGGGGTNNPTEATCPNPTPVAPVTGYKIKACDDFNNGLGDFGPYDGGGESTVVGGGRKSSQCAATGGLLVLTQNSDGSTCGGSMGNHNGRYGYWEVKMRAYSTGNGSGSKPHPVLILWPDSNRWEDGELDYFETDIGEGIGGYFHCTDGSGIQNNCFVLPDKDVDYGEFHVYGLEWRADGATGYIDGEKWYETNSSSWQPKTSSHQTIQLDNLSGNTPVNPGKMEVDWVHTYSK